LKSNIDIFISIEAKLMKIIVGIVTFVIKTEEKNSTILDYEYDLLLEKLDTFQKHGSKRIGLELSFDHLEAGQFEDFCFEYLNSRGFLNVANMGNTNAPDGGVDITCDETISGIFGAITRKYIWQCRHSKKPISKSEINTIIGLMEENKATFYGILSTGNLTPSAIKRINEKNELLGHQGIIRRDIKILSYELQTNHPELVRKYKLWGSHKI
jgi:hypothetical protein